MELDFTTLFALVLLNSIGFAIVWAVISISYRSLIAARYWFAALMMTSLSGPFLIFGMHSQLLSYTGNTLVIIGFGLIWQGIRLFQRQNPLWGWLIVIVLLSILTMSFFGNDQVTSNIIFAVGQMVPMTAALITLLTAQKQQVGIWVAAGSCLLLIIGQSLEAITNLLRLFSFMSTDTYYDYAPWFLVMAILGVSISNLGFLLMTVDRLRDELYILAVQDELTDLPNRRALVDRLRAFEKSAKHQHSSVTTFMIDLDKFKEINDAHGHPAGDAALIHFSDVIQRNLSHRDFVARIGGDEFCILMPDIDNQQAKQFGKILTKEIGSAPFKWNDKELVLSASIGIHRWHPSSGVPLKLSMTFADENLMQLKSATLAS